MSGPRFVLATAEHEAIKGELTDILQRHRDVDAADVLAIAAQITGMLLALQDRRTMTVERGMAVVMANVEQGNVNMVQQMTGQGGLQ